MFTLNITTVKCSIATQPNRINRQFLFKQKSIPFFFSLLHPMKQSSRFACSQIHLIMVKSAYISPHFFQNGKIASLLICIAFAIKAFHLKSVRNKMRN